MLKSSLQLLKEEKQAKNDTRSHRKMDKMTRTEIFWLIYFADLCGNHNLRYIRDGKVEPVVA